MDGIIDAKQDFPHQSYVPRAIFYQKNFDGHIFLF
jgi:hypothetical protein